MKIRKTLLALSVLTAAAQSHAMVYRVTGSLDAVNTVGAAVNPTLYVHSGSSSYSSSSSIWPTFAGVWDIATSGNSGSISGIFADFVQYSTSFSLVSGMLTAVINQPNLVYSFNGGTVTYDAATRTFRLGQPLIYSNTDAAVPNNQTSDGALKFDTAAGAIPAVCSGQAIICSQQRAQFLDKPDLERFYLTLTFSPDFSTFSGTAIGGDVGGPVPGGNTGNMWYAWSFNGAAVPVPATAWLLGSGLAGLAGFARRRRRAGN